MFALVAVLAVVVFLVAGVFLVVAAVFVVFFGAAFFAVAVVLGLASLGSFCDTVSYR